MIVEHIGEHRRLEEFLNQIEQVHTESERRAARNRQPEQAMFSAARLSEMIQSVNRAPTGEVQQHGAQSTEYRIIIHFDFVLIVGELARLFAVVAFQVLLLLLVVMVLVLLWIIVR